MAQLTASSEVRLLLPGSAIVGDLGPDGAGGPGREEAVQAIADLYAYPDPLPAGGWVRANMVASMDGSATGADGRSGSVSSPADQVVFRVLRGLADTVLVGAGTVRGEGYHVPAAKPEFAERRATAGQAPAPPLAVVTRSGHVSGDGALFRGPTPTYLVTCARADLARLRAEAGPEHVIVAGADSVDPRRAVAELAERGLRRVLLEGGPSLLAQFAADGRLDELCLSWTPIMVGDGGPRIAHGPTADLRLQLAHLAECGGTLLGRWLVQR